MMKAIDALGHGPKAQQMETIRETLRETIKNISPNRSPNRTPPRSRANSIGGSNEDQNAPLTEEGRRQMLNAVREALDEAGFIDVNAGTGINKSLKKSKIKPS